MKGASATVAAGFVLTALSYGLARFAYGLLLPQISADLDLSPVVAGWIGGSSFAAYCVGIVAALLLSGRFGARLVGLLAGLAAAGGMALASVAASGPVLGAGIALAGLSSGLTSPPLAAAVAARVETARRDRANGAINAGTAAGIVFSGLVAVAAIGSWRDIYGLFALIAAGVAAWIWWVLPGRGGGGAVRLSPALLARPGLPRLVAAAGLYGVAIAGTWTFGADILRERMHFSQMEIACAWVVLGVGGIAGVSTGSLLARFGVAQTLRLALLLTVISSALLACGTSLPAVGYLSMALFGLAYIVATGSLLVWGIDRLPDRPDAGLAIPFLLVAAGQTIGAPLFGAVLQATDTPSALFLFAVIACGGMVMPPTGPTDAAASGPAPSPAA
ncbi:MFS transporter [Mangrovibrevibacter kandeliae]|uniref:MFS transporter n=1 Tax=Mangrovibrevibacter kandeliae TaxID=2968473 RepID=UPI0021189D39|nr:MFS transporter [Aurantimonas sp. CSK15Z-1]MCQ8781952.1 MFS transporter [Aurantimonas sp. CSK15Z-1]